MLPSTGRGMTGDARPTWATEARQEALDYMTAQEHVHEPVQNMRHHKPVDEWFCGVCMEKLPRPPDTLTFASTGPQNARIDTRTGLRFYTWRDRSDLLSVTSARTEAGMPHGLHQWALSQVVDRAIDQHEEMHAILERPRKPRERVRDKNVLAEARAWLRAAATEQRDRSAALGTAVHDYAAQGIVPEDVPEVTEIVDGSKTWLVKREDILPRLNWFISWLRVSGAMVLGQEFQVWNLTQGYAGSTDLLVRFPNGQVWLIDLKTGEGTYFEHALQVTAYMNAEFVGRDGVIDEHLTGYLSQVDACAVLHLNEHGWEFVKVRSDGKVYRAFLNVLGFARTSLELAHHDEYVLARRRFPDPGQAIVDDMQRELERRTQGDAA